jgi:hypothetical protein
VGATAALGHGAWQWIEDYRLYDPQTGDWCCGKNDCGAIEGDGISQTSLGYQIKATGEVIPYSRVIWESPDGKPWRCWNTYGERKGLTRCLIMPPPST